MRAAIVLSLVTFAACGGDGGAKLPDAAAAADADLAIDAAPAREIIMETQPLQATELVEGIMTGGPSDAALIHLEAPVSELDWNIHGHANGGTQTVYEELDKMTVDYVFVPGAQADWWLLLRNSGPTNMDVKVTIRLYGNMQWRWQ
jgi:predicted small lipoprotein YifL